MAVVVLTKDESRPIYGKLLGAWKTLLRQQLRCLANRDWTICQYHSSNQHS